MKVEHGRLIHLGLIGSLVFTPLAAVILRLFLGKLAGPWFMISDLGTEAPESYLFIFGSVLSSILAMSLAFYLWRFHPRNWRLNLSLVFIIFWAIGLLMVGVFPSNSSPELHLLGATITFISLPVASLVIVNWSKNNLLFASSQTIKGGYILPLTAIFVSLIFNISHEIAHRMHPEVKFMTEMGDEVGWFALFTSLEWILGAIFVFVIISWQPLFQPPAETEISTSEVLI